jgi:hypothetical protein
MDALGETMVVRHPVDRQVFHGDPVKLIDDATALLVSRPLPSGWEMNGSEHGPFDLERRQCRLLIVQAQRILPLLPRIASFGQQVIVQPAALLQLLLQVALLLLVWIQTGFERLAHARGRRLKHTGCQAEAAIHLPA